jgi:hypothetical protein
MSNSYGFDFLKSEHLIDAPASTDVFAETANQNDTTSSNQASLLLDDESFRKHEMLAQNKPDLEKQYDILAFLQKHTRTNTKHCLPPNIIYRATGIDLQSPDNANVATMLMNNPKIHIEYTPDPENPNLLIPHYAYRAKYPNVVDRASLLGQINRMRDTGIPMIRDLYDSYPGIEQDIQQCITAGEVICLANPEDRDKILFPRGDVFFVELDGIVTIPSGATTSVAAPDRLWNGGTLTNGDAKHSIYLIHTDVDPRRQIRRGEAIQVGGQWFRVSSAVKEGVPLSEQPVRAQAPLSVVSLTELSSRNELDGYVRPLNNQIIPLDAALSQTAVQNIQAAKMAREQLSKLSHTVGGARHATSTNSSSSTIIGQLIGSYAHSSNPTTLASSLSSSSTHPSHTSLGMHRKRPGMPNAISSSSAAAPKLDAAASDPALALYNHARRHGCTKDVRELYLQTRAWVPESDAALQSLLREHKLLEPGESMRRARLKVSLEKVDNDGKPKKRRYYERKNQRMTNTHLDGTEIGALLALAAEKQKQGQSVGDGGM